MADHLKARLKLGQVVVASYSEGARERLKGLLEDEGVKGISLAGTMRDVPEGNAPVNLVHLDDCIGVIEALIQQAAWGKLYNVCADDHPRKDVNHEGDVDEAVTLAGLHSGPSRES